MVTRKPWPGPGPHRELLAQVALRVSSRPKLMARALKSGEAPPRGLKKEIYTVLYHYLRRRGYPLAQENTINQWFLRGTAPQALGELNDIAHGRIEIGTKVTLRDWRRVTKRIEDIWLHTHGQGVQWRRLERAVQEVWEATVPSTMRHHDDDGDSANAPPTLAAV